MTKSELQELISDITIPDLRALYAIIGGKLSKRKITLEQQAKMQVGRRKPPT